MHWLYKLHDHHRDCDEFRLDRSSRALPLHFQSARYEIFPLLPSSPIGCIALFGAGLLRLHPYHVPRDVDLGRKRLEDFEKQFPNHRYLAGALVALGLQEELSSTENKIAFSRQAYNDSVMEYNTKRESFPDNIFAGMFGFSAAELLQSTDTAEERKAPKVSFS